MRLYSYVVQHDYGDAPNPYWGFCTLALCKFRKKNSHPRNLVEMACVGDWVVGTGGADKRMSAGNGNLIFAMRVEDKLPLRRYWSGRKFNDKKPVRNGEYSQRRGDNKRPGGPFEENERFVLISWDEWYYFGKNARRIPREFRNTLEKKGPKYKVKFEPEFVDLFLNWLKKTQKPGKHGEPWGKEFKLSQEMRKRRVCESSC